MGKTLLERAEEKRMAMQGSKPESSGRYVVTSELLNRAEQKRREMLEPKETSDGRIATGQTVAGRLVSGGYHPTRNSKSHADKGVFDIGGKYLASLPEYKGLSPRQAAEKEAKRLEKLGYLPLVEDKSRGQNSTGVNIHVVTPGVTSQKWINWVNGERKKYGYKMYETEGMKKAKSLQAEEQKKQKRIGFLERISEDQLNKTYVGRQYTGLKNIIKDNIDDVKHAYAEMKELKKLNAAYIVNPEGKLEAARSGAKGAWNGLMSLADTVGFGLPQARRRFGVEGADPTSELLATIGTTPLGFAGAGGVLKGIGKGIKSATTAARVIKDVEGATKVGKLAGGIAKAGGFAEKVAQAVDKTNKYIGASSPLKKVALAGTKGAVENLAISGAEKGVSIASGLKTPGEAWGEFKENAPTDIAIGAFAENVLQAFNKPDIPKVEPTTEVPRKYHGSTTEVVPPVVQTPVTKFKVGEKYNFDDLGEGVVTKQTKAYTTVEHATESGTTTTRLKTADMLQKNPVKITNAEPVVTVEPPLVVEPTPTTPVTTSTTTNQPVTWMTQDEFVASGDDLLHGTNRQFDMFTSEGTKNRYGKPNDPNQGRFYFTDKPEVADTFAHSGSYRQVDVDKFAEANDLEDNVIPELRKELDKAIKAGRRVVYVDADTASPTVGQLIEVKKANDISDDYLYDGDVRVYSKQPRVVNTKVYGKTLDLTDPNKIPDDLRTALQKEAIYRPWENAPNDFAHENSRVLYQYARENGYGKIKVKDAYESGHTSIIGLEEYIGLGKDPDVMYQSLKEKYGIPVTDGVELRHAGLDPRAAMQVADDVSIRQDPRMGVEGTFTADNAVSPAGRDYHMGDDFLQPLGIYGADGSIIQAGVYDRLGNIETPEGLKNVGTLIGQAMQSSQATIDNNTATAKQTIGRITTLLHDGQPAPKFDPFGTKQKKTTDKIFKDFVDLVEKPYDDAGRQAIKNSDTPLGEALRLHDDMTEGFRQYIIDARNSMGIETPKDWGITENGYFRHLFLGDIRMFVDGEFVGTANTYAEAQKKALDILKANPKAVIKAKARNITYGDPTVRVSNAKYFKLVGEISGELNLSNKDIMEDLRGIVGRKAGQTKMFGALNKRTGAKGFETNYQTVMNAHATQMFRTQELSKLKRVVQPMIEQLNRNGKPVLAKAIENHMNALWGIPSDFELKFGSVLRSIPGVRNQIANPDMAFRRVAQNIKGLQSVLKLKGSPRSALINLIQPFSTLLPYIEAKEFGVLYKDFMNKDIRRMLYEKGVLDSSSKIESVSKKVQLKPKSSYMFYNWFEKASEVNRGIGYLYGYKKSIRQGLSEAEAHAEGRAWAEKVEFNNSVWNVPAILRSPGTGLIGQFKSFQLKNLENVRDVFTPQGISKAEKAGRISKWLGVQLGMGGMRSLGMVAKAFTGYALIDHLSKQLQSYGMEKDEADRWSNAVYYGAPSLLGLDLSGSIAVFEEPYGSSRDAQIVNLLGGVQVGTALGLMKAWDEKDPAKAAKAITPMSKTVDVLGQWMQTPDSLETQVKTGREEYVKLNEFESIMRAMGFTPMKQSLVYDKKDAGIGKRVEPKSVLGESELWDELTRLNIKIGSPAKVLKAGALKVEISDDDIAAYDERVLEAIKSKVTPYINSKIYQEADDEKKTRLLKQQVNHARTSVYNQVKQEVKAQKK